MDKQTASMAKSDPIVFEQAGMRMTIAHGKAWAAAMKG
jgi:hypothetical protein